MPDLQLLGEIEPEQEATQGFRGGARGGVPAQGPYSPGCPRFAEGGRKAAGVNHTTFHCLAEGPSS